MNKRETVQESRGEKFVNRYTHTHTPHTHTLYRSSATFSCDAVAHDTGPHCSP